MVISQFVDNENLRDTFPYLDYVSVAGKTQKEHDFNVQAFLDAIHRNNFTHNETKTIGSVSNIQIIVMLLESSLIKPGPKGLQPSRELSSPTSFKLLKCSLEMIG